MVTVSVLWLVCKAEHVPSSTSCGRRSYQPAVWHPTTIRQWLSRHLCYYGSCRDRSQLLCHGALAPNASINLTFLHDFVPCPGTDQIPHRIRGPGRSVSPAASFSFRNFHSVKRRNTPNNTRMLQLLIPLHSYLCCRDPDVNSNVSARNRTKRGSWKPYRVNDLWNVRTGERMLSACFVNKTVAG